MVSGSISFPCSGFFSPFLHSTGSLSVTQSYLALRDGARGFRQGFSGPALLRIHLTTFYTRTGLSPSIVPLSIGLPILYSMLNGVLQPRTCRNRFGLGSSPFARHYLENHYYFLFLQVLRCFSSLSSPPLRDDRPSVCRVAPFGNLRIIARLQLPEAYRSLPRPSSPLSAKASATYPSFVPCYLFI